MPPLVVIHSDDIDHFAKADLPLPVVILEESGEQFLLRLDGEPVSTAATISRIVCGVAASQSATTALQTLINDINQTGAGSVVQICDLSAIKREKHPEAASKFIARALGNTVERQAVRNVALSKSTAALRDVHMKTQAAFQQLEQFVLQNNLAKRTESVSLLPADAAGSILVSDADVITQRLSMASTGLCDVALFIDHSELPLDGNLSVSLLTQEDDTLRAEWNVTTSEMSKGRVRLSLPASLDTEPLTAMVRIHWQGVEPLRLCCSMFNPDPRFQIQGAADNDGRVLAHCCWTYLPASEAPVPPDGLLPNDLSSNRPRVTVLDRDAMSSPLNLNTLNTNVRYLPECDALMVHVLSVGTAAAILPSALVPGAISVSAVVRTQFEQAPPIQYAIAVGPASQRVAPDNDPQQSAELMFSQWMTVKPLERGELRILLPDPITEAHDLYLMTRLPSGVADSSWGWSTFGSITVSYSRG